MDYRPFYVLQIRTKQFEVKKIHVLKFIFEVDSHYTF